MTRAERAKIFMPFSALNGYYDLILAQEEGHEVRREIDEEKAAAISEKLNKIDKGSSIEVEYYNNGCYLTEKLDAVFEDFKQTSPFFRTLRIDERNNGIFEPVLMYLAELLHCLRLGIIQKAEQHFTVKGETAVEVSGVSDSKAVTVAEYCEQFGLILFFSKNIVHVI